MIELAGISYSYPYAREGDRQLADIDLSIAEGECVVLSGGSGCGKTTLTRVLNGLAVHLYGGAIEGSYSFDGRDALDLPINELGSLIASVFQDPRSQFFSTNTTDEVVLGMENVPVPRSEMDARLAEMRSLLGIERLLDRRIFPLSSGEKQRIAIGSAAVMQPRAIVLDEPSANLDAEGIAHLSTLLGRLKARGTAIVLSEHRLHYVRDFFDRLVVLENGRIARTFSREEALALTDAELADLGLRAFSETRISMGGALAEDRSAALFAQTITYAGPTSLILDEASFSAEAGRICAVVGENGAGKSSLARSVTGVLRGASGSVAFANEPTSRRKRVRRSFFVQQDADYQLYAATVAGEFFIGCKATDGRREAAARALGDVGLAGFEERHPLSLSGGQKQRLLLALAAVSERELLVFDEPTSGLDGRNMRMTARLLRKLADGGACVLLVTHDQDLISLVADDVLYMTKGKVAYRKRIVR